MNTSLALNADVSDLKHVLERQIEDVNERLAALSQRIVHLSAQLDQAVAAAAAGSDNVTQTLNEMNTNIVAYVNGLVSSAASRDEVRQLVSRIDQLESKPSPPSLTEVQSLVELSNENLTRTLNTMNSEIVSYIEKRIGELDRRAESTVSRDDVHKLLTQSNEGVDRTLKLMSSEIVSYVEKRLGERDERIKAHAGVVPDGVAVPAGLQDGLDRLLARIGLTRRDTSTAAGSQGISELLNTMNANLVGYVEKRLSELAEECYELIMQARGAALAGGTERLGGRVRKDKPIPVPQRRADAPVLNEVFQSLERRAPAAWPVFQAALDTGTRSYEGFPIGSCSVEGHAEAERFAGFIAPYLRGYVLDVGCGPQPVPSYLQDYPLELIRGIDPISSAADHPFEFVSAVAEDIPWHDSSFDVVCSGTTLDHFFLLDAALQEIYRVLKPGGHFVAWISEAPGSEPYDPYREHVTAADEEHLFHIDREWFLPMMRKLGFEESEILAFSVPFAYLFMSFRKPVAR